MAGADWMLTPSSAAPPVARLSESLLSSSESLPPLLPFRRGLLAGQWRPTAERARLV